MDTGVQKSRIGREKHVIVTMIKLYCQKNHRYRRSTGGHELCPACRKLFQYAVMRLDRCRYGENKSFCTNCPTHCYQKMSRQQIKEIMRFSGPRMLFHHPVIAIKHMLSKR